MAVPVRFKFMCSRADVPNLCSSRSTCIRSCLFHLRCISCYPFAPGRARCRRVSPFSMLCIGRGGTRSNLHRSSQGWGRATVRGSQRPMGFHMRPKRCRPPPTRPYLTSKARCFVHEPNLHASSAQHGCGGLHPSRKGARCFTTVHPDACWNACGVALLAGRSRPCTRQRRHVRSMCLTSFFCTARPLGASPLSKDTKAALDADTKFQMELETSCSTKTAEWEDHASERSKAVAI